MHQAATQPCSSSIRAWQHRHGATDCSPGKVRWSSCIALLFFCLACIACSSGEAVPAGTTVTPTPTPLVVAQYTPSSVPVVTTGVSTFTGNLNMRIPVKTTVQFVDPATKGGYHILFTGIGGKYFHQAGAPAALDSSKGVSITAGTTLTFPFDAPGTYDITCSLHPAMIVQITVTP